MELSVNEWWRYAAISALLMAPCAAWAEESCITVSDVEFSKKEVASEVDWQAVVTNDCGPDISVMLEVLVLDGSDEGNMLYSTKVAETINQRGRKLVKGTFFVPVFVLSNLEQIDVTIMQAVRSY